MIKGTGHSQGVGNAAILSPPLPPIRSLSSPPKIDQMRPPCTFAVGITGNRIRSIVHAWLQRGISVLLSTTLDLIPLGLLIQMDVIDMIGTRNCRCPPMCRSYPHSLPPSLAGQIEDKR